MPTTANASARVPAKASLARTRITAAWGRMRIALAASALCQNTQVRTDLLGPGGLAGSLYVAGPPRAARGGISAPLAAGARCAKRTPLATVEGQIAQLRQGVARLIDSYAEGLIDKDEFEPRITRVRQRLARLEEQRQQLADEAALHAELQLIIGRLRRLCHQSSSVAWRQPDWASKRDLIRALVKRVEVARDDVNIVFRIDPYPGDADPEKKVCNFVGECSPRAGQYIPPSCAG